MNPLYRNDAPGQLPNSWYVASLPAAPPRPALSGDTTCDVAIVGAGYTGLWAARILAASGRRVVVLDAHRVGFGASGRNGGQVHRGYTKDQAWLEAKLGQTRAHALWDLAQTGKSQLRDFCNAHPDTQYRPGIAHCEYHARDLDAMQAEAEYLARHYDYSIDVMDRAAFRDLVRSDSYQGGTFDPDGGHVHPLAYARALAQDAEDIGASLFERTEVTAIAPGAPLRLITPRGAVTADHAILAGNGYLPNLSPGVNARVMPINSFIAATEPVPELWQDVLARDIAVADSRFVVNYFRFTQDRRFLFGGRESYGMGFPKDIETALVARMIDMFPQLAGTKVEYVWGGALGITPSRLPYIGRLGPNVLAGAGFSGQGVALSGMAGRVLAEAILGQDRGLATCAALPVPEFPGGTRLRAPILALAMTWFALRDRLGI
ncbi:MAG: FAD-binding oxidoreductase [Pseudomonadota bacterium]